MEAEIQRLINGTIADKETCNNFLARSKEGLPTRDENPTSHFCVYFLPFNFETKEVFLIHHKKSGLWIFPGGHIDKGESLLVSLRREIQEELGMQNVIRDDIKPFLLTITEINEPGRTLCHLHYDVWYRFQTNPGSLNVDPREFLDTKWITIDEARKYVTDGPNKKALDLMDKFFTPSPPDPNKQN